MFLYLLALRSIRLPQRVTWVKHILTLIFVYYGEKCCFCGSQHSQGPPQGTHILTFNAHVWKSCTSALWVLQASAGPAHTHTQCLCLLVGSLASVPGGPQHRQGGSAGHAGRGPLHPQRHLHMDQPVRHPAQPRSLGGPRRLQAGELQLCGDGTKICLHITWCLPQGLDGSGSVCACMYALRRHNCKAHCYVSQHSPEHGPKAPSHTDLTKITAVVLMLALWCQWCDNADC